MGLACATGPLCAASYRGLVARAPEVVKEADYRVHPALKAVQTELLIGRVDTKLLGLAPAQEVDHKRVHHPLVRL